VVVSVFYTVATGFLSCLLFWWLSPSLVKIRDSFRERAANAPLSPDAAAKLFKELWIQQASLKRLKYLRANPLVTTRFIMRLLSEGLLLFALAVFLYPFRSVLGDVCYIPAFTSVLLFLLAALETRTTDEKADEALTIYRKRVREIKTRLGLA
jgi:hypothetical protein